MAVFVNTQALANEVSDPTEKRLRKNLKVMKLNNLKTTLDKHSMFNRFLRASLF